ncbi:MAG: hypothetical protein EZS28_025512 [Streblomastix strix]|uniref:Uncharacterized protein n=1 Tax=Streblomastix strix TaxID=222440 RepID=A0A5J4V910_9EUKA|nr:MAG: hypothetical protein EZS28_025512 [Streblomastix strix]
MFLIQITAALECLVHRLTSSAEAPLAITFVIVAALIGVTIKFSPRAASVIIYLMNLLILSIEYYYPLFA